MRVRTEVGVKGQSIFEYFVLTIIVVSIALYFAKTKAYQDVNRTANASFNAAVDKIITGGAGG